MLQGGPALAHHRACVHLAPLQVRRVVAEYLGYFQASSTSGGITSGSQWLVWKFESDSTLGDACDGTLGPFPVSDGGPHIAYMVVQTAAGGTGSIPTVAGPGKRMAWPGGLHACWAGLLGCARRTEASRFSGRLVHPLGLRCSRAATCLPCLPA